MIIKQPYDNIALCGLLNAMNSLRNRVKNCVDNKHKTLTIIYVSSFVITEEGLDKPYQGKSILNILETILNSSPSSIVCILRTSSPAVLGKIGPIHKKAINLLRSKCYVMLYGRVHSHSRGYGVFSNHAKFILGYHYCFSENAFHHMRYYGSTNLTLAGLAYYSKHNLGNYEEFYLSPVRRYPPQCLPIHKYYLDEACRIVADVNNLYSDKQFLRKYVNTHLTEFQNLLETIEKVVKGTTKAQLFQSYVELQAIYLQVLSFISDLPGKKFTSDVIEGVTNEVKPPSPLEVEVMLTDDEKDAEEIADLLNLSEGRLRDECMKYLNIIRRTLNSMKGYPIDNIERYYDDIENKFNIFLRENGRTHLTLLKELNEKISKVKGGTG